MEQDSSFMFHVSSSMMYIIDVIHAVKIPNLETSVWSYFSPYALPEGALVQVPLGRRHVPSVVVSAHEAHTQKIYTKKSAFQMKSVTKTLSFEPVLNSVQFKLLAWCAEYYFFPPPLFLKIMLPPYLAQKKTPVSLGQQPYKKEISAGARQKPILYFGHNRFAAYKKTIDACIKQKKQALIITPEITKVETLERELSLYHPAVLTGELSPKKFFAAWDSIRMGTARVIIGTKTAVFANFADLGLIIVDEEQSPHLKSWDMAPHYHAGDTALQLAELTNATVAFGSAAPSISSFYKAREGTYALSRTEKEKEGKKDTPSILTVDMRNELRDKNYSCLSYQLKNALEKIIASPEKRAMLFVSRRGNTSFSFCQDCGHIEKCPRCETHMVRHKTPGDALICHLCGFTKEPHLVCPLCDGTRIKNFGAGTHAVKEEIEKWCGYKDALILDSDSAKTPRMQKTICNAFADGSARIMIGTQTMLNKPAIPKVDLLGIVSLDNLLYIPEYTAGERIYRLMNGLLKYCRRDTTVIFQTNTPEYKPLGPIITQNYERFFEQEIQGRKEYGYPPFSRIVKLIFKDASQSKAEQKANTAAGKLARAIAEMKADVELAGPAPAYIPKMKNQYFYHLILKIKNVPLKTRNEIVRLVADDAEIDADPENLL